MVSNQELFRDNTEDIRESFRVLKENKIIATNNANIAKNIEAACTINRAFFNGIANIRITAKLWGQR